jgi:hypothetical protein
MAAKMRQALDMLKIYAGSTIDHVDRLPTFSAGK